MLITPKTFEENSIDQSFLENLIQNGIEEDYQLDYKGIEYNNNAEIAKDISSFANTEGGNIIYGICEKDNKPSEIFPINDQGFKERIDQISQTGIDPPLNIRIWPIDVNVNNQSGQVFVLYIPKKYPHLHFAKKKKRYYKRTNFTSTPMERYEIEQAFYLKEKVQKDITLILEQVNREFIELIGEKSFQFRFIVHPVEYGRKIFDINIETNKQITKIIPKTKKFQELIFSGTPINHFRVNDYYFPPDIETNPGSCLIRNDGIIIYNLGFLLYDEFELEEFIKLLEIEDYIEDIDNIDPHLYLRKGISPEECIFDRDVILDYFFSFLDFIHDFYSEFDYHGDMKIILNLDGLDKCVDGHAGTNLRQKELESIEHLYNVDFIPKIKIQIAKEFFNPIFRGFGYWEIDLEPFYFHLKNYYTY